MSKLNEKQNRFCQEYVVDLNGTQAAIRAGYSEKTANRIASQLLSKLDIQDRVKELQESRSERTQIDADWVLREAAKVYKVAVGEEPTKVVVRDSIGDGITEHRTQEFLKHDLTAANKTLEIIGKHVDIQAWRERIDVSHSAEDLLDEL